MSAPNRRTMRLIEPRIQRRFVLLFLSTAALAALLQTVVVTFLLLRAVDRLPNDTWELKAEIGWILANSLLVTVTVLVPLTLAVGVVSTHKIVGPLYRFRIYLTQLAAGERPAPCCIRQGDELQDFCELLNRATAPLRGAEGAAAERREAA